MGSKPAIQADQQSLGALARGGCRLGALQTHTHVNAIGSQNSRFGIVRGADLDRRILDLDLR
jgi:hypothetical protein